MGRGVHRGFITHEELSKSLGKRNLSLNNLDHIELGDIFISLEMALEQSYEYKHSIYREMIWLASHGFLHLLGWEHNNEHDLENMLNFQEYLITRLD